MKNSILSTIGALLISIASAYAQGYVFKVLGTKGTNTVAGNPLKVGSTIMEGQSITVGNDAYLGLAHKSGKTIEIRKAGTYTTKELEAKLSTSQSSLADQYAQFIIDELTGGDAVASRQSRMAKTGSVQRALSAPIQFMLPSQTDVIDSKVMIKWYLSDASKAKDITKYKFTVKNMFGDVLLVKEVDQPYIVLDLNSEELRKEEKALMYSVAAVGAPEINSGDEEYSLKKLKPSEVANIKREMAQLPPYDESALNKVIMARFFEDRGLLANSIFAFEDAISSSEQVEQYQNMYNQFLNRNMLTKESRTKNN
ncbi:MAG: hypothetical protein NZM38_04080 [Cytophagales bacterium]|nr:hypothetical protein [Cytophagales bacterium]MDW8383929.1 hypothetical protein [Flammeovirgaceae bacterium]